MSATTPIQVTEKKARKPTLSAKYSKFMVFGYNFVQSLRASDILNDEGLENAYAQLKMFDTVDTQSEFYEQFLSQSGESGRVMRKFIVQRNKPPKAPRKPRAKKAATTTEPTTTETTTTTTETAKEKKPRKPRTKKTTEVVQDTQNDVISEIVAAANADPLENIAVETTTEPAVKEKKARKPRAKKATEPSSENKTEEDFAKEEQERMKRKALLAKMAATTPEKKSTEPVKTPEKKAPRAPKKKKVETQVEVTPPFVESEELEEEEIVTQEIVIGGETYLIDGDNNLYSTQTHLEVGTYNQDTQEISLNA